MRLSERAHGPQQWEATAAWLGWENMPRNKGRCGTNARTNAKNPALPFRHGTVLKPHTAAHTLAGLTLRRVIRDRVPRKG